MPEFLMGVAGFVLVMVALGWIRILRGPARADRMMAAQLFGTGGIAALLLLGAGTGVGAVVDVALVLAVLAVFASIAFVEGRYRGRRMSGALDLLSMVAIASGAFFFMAGTVGLLRFPDTMTRLHALTKADNLGLGLIVLGLIPQFESGVAAVKLIVVWLLVLIASAVVSQLIARAARRGSLQP